MGEKLVKDPSRLVATIESAFPLARNMDKFFSFGVKVFQITLPKRLEVDLMTLADQREVVDARQRAAREAGEKIRRDMFLVGGFLPSIDGFSSIAVGFKRGGEFRYAGT